ncbi:hypothetical protein [Rubrivirga sp.]|uniref:hypothetical protein n=1 Tax=Rubrivirga sp. TaxID=1885344 RepID=UPI003B52F287
MAALSPSARVLRDNAPLEPFLFQVLDEDEPLDAAALPAFVPFPSLFPDPVGEAPEDGPDAESAEALEAAQAAAHDAETDALRAEVDRLTAALDQANDAREAASDAARQTADRLTDLWAEALRQIEPELVALALEAAEAVLDAPLSPDQRAAADHALAETVDGLAGGGPVVVAVPPVDLLHLQESGLAATLSGAHPDLRWEPSDALAEGDWSVSTSQAAVRRVRADMLATLRDRLGLDALER